MKVQILFLIVAVATAATPAKAAEVNNATVTDLAGQVVLFTDPGKEMKGPAPHVLFSGEYFSFRDATAGDTVANGNIVRTSPIGKARVIFPNGDQFYVGPQTAYRISWAPGSTGKGTATPVNVALMYGSVRGVVEKGGPRSKLVIKTRSATMGVRGTDFFIDDHAGKTETTISVLRGKVEVKPTAVTKTAGAPKPIQVEAGFSARIPTPPPAPAPAPTKVERGKITPPTPPPVAPVIELARTTQEELKTVKETSSLPPAPTAAEKGVTLASAQPSMDAESAARVKELQSKAIETTMKDVQATDPKAYEALKDRKIESVDEINSQVVQKLAEKAPVRRKIIQIREETEEQMRKQLEERNFNGAE